MVSKDATLNDVVDAMDDFTRVMGESLSSPNEMDSNFEPANVVDGLFAIARAIHRLANALDRGPEGE